MTSEKHNILKELQEIAPNLAKVEKGVPKEIPEGYFDIVENQILAQLHLIKAEDNAKAEVPVEYFDKVEKEILGNITNEASKPKVVSIFKTSRQMMYKVAASLVFLIAFVTVFNVYYSPSTVEVAAVSQDEYIQYISDHIEEFDINLLIEQEVLNEQVLNNFSYIDVGEDFDESWLDDNEIILK